MDNNFFDFSLEPGKELKEKREYLNKQTVVSVVVPFYNDKQYIRQSVNAILNQTFPYYELLIIDDGSKDEESLKELESVEKLDPRIKVFHKQNEGLAATRDYGAKQASKETKYLLFVDSDDLIEPTFIECAYWTLETNKKASWAYTDVVGFEGQEYTWNKWFDSNRMKKINDLVSMNMIKKEDFWSVGGYGLREKGVNEDWNMWLKLIAKGKYPVRMNFYGFWYRRKVNSGELLKSRQNKKRSLEIINQTASMIKKKVTAIQYPKKDDYNWDILLDNYDDVVIPEQKNNNKINILMLIPWMTVGGADKFNLDFLRLIDKNRFNVTVITSEPQVNVYRQEFEKYAEVFDLTTFIDKKYWLAFLNYIIKSRNINFIFNTNSRFGYVTLPYLKGKYPQIPIIDYVHMEEWYNRNGGYSRDTSAVESVIDKTLVCNKNSEKILVDHFGKNKNEIETVYIGVDESKYKPETLNKEEILRKYKIESKNKFIISYICRIAEQKRPHLLIKIIKRLKETRNDFIFVIAGEGYMLNAIKKEVKNYHLNDNVVFLGNVTNTQEIYKISDLTINCSIKEGVALTSYESLAMGVPVVSADVGGQKELINEEVGKIVPCMQKEEEILNFVYKKEEIENYVTAINEVLSNLDSYKEKCRQRILDGFTLKQMNEKMDQTITEIYKNPNKEKIENGKGMGRNLDVAKELICYFLEESNEQYSWQCLDYNSNYYELTREMGVTRWSKIKERLWTIPLWRGFIRVLQKLGIINAVKKIVK